MKIVMELPEGVSEQLAQTIIQDALYEFVAHRGPTTEDYVTKRYPFWSTAMQAEKANQVNRRIIVATEMLQSLRFE